MGWAPGARITEADRAGNVKSLRRRLEDRLVLLVKGQGASGYTARPETHVPACAHRWCCCCYRERHTAQSIMIAAELNPACWNVAGTPVL